MNEKTREIFRRLGVYEDLGMAYHSLRSIRGRQLWQELKFRFGPAPDKWPIPPSRLIFLAIGHGWPATYWQSGKLLADAMERQLEQSGVHFADFNRVLDLGCGCGRLLRHLPALTKAALHGCDYNSRHISWCQHNLPFAQFTRNSLLPPLPYQDHSFDFIYMRSVFTHLTRESQLAWLGEIHRVLHPGGILLFTTQGELFAANLAAAQAAIYRDTGFVENHGGKEGSNAYGTFQTSDYTLTELGRGFAPMGFWPGQANENQRQDTYIWRNR